MHNAQTQANGGRCLLKQLLTYILTYSPTTAHWWGWKRLRDNIYMNMYKYTHIRMYTHKYTDWLLTYHNTRYEYLYILQE